MGARAKVRAPPPLSYGRNPVGASCDSPSAKPFANKEAEHGPRLDEVASAEAPRLGREPERPLQRPPSGPPWRRRYCTRDVIQRRTGEQDRVRGDLTPVGMHPV